MKGNETKRYVSFETTEEFLIASKQHRSCLKKDNLDKIKYFPFLQVTEEQDEVALISAKRNESLEEILTFNRLFDEYTWEDGTPCGKEISK